MSRSMEATAYQRARWLRPDAERWMRPDAYRWRKPVHPDEQKYNPNQPRVPAGNPDGGQWTDADGAFGGPQATHKPQGINDSRVLSDADPEPLIPGAQYAQGESDSAGSGRSRGGHHIVPQSLYRDWSPEARSVLQRETIGPIDNKLLQSGSDGKPTRHLYDSQHRQYNRALTDLSERFLRENDIDPKRMTSVQALEFRARVEVSQDPRIRDYNATMRALAKATRTLRLLRGE